MLSQGQLAGKTVVATVMSNAGLDHAVRALGGNVIRTSVGDKNVIDEMVRNGYNLGGEQSGHMIFRDYGTTGDGLVCALQILRIMKTRDAKLSELAHCWSRFPQVITNIKVREKKPFEEMDGLLALVQTAELAVEKDGGRLLLRYSGTEPTARLLMEGRDRQILDHWSLQIAEQIKRHVGA